MELQLQIKFIARVVEQLRDANQSREQIKEHVRSTCTLMDISAPEIIQNEIIDRVLTGKPLNL